LPHSIEALGNLAPGQAVPPAAMTERTWEIEAPSLAITVRWGDTSQPTAKVDALQALLEQADRATIDRIDITVPRASTITRTGSEP